MPKYFKLTRRYIGSYIQKGEDLLSALDAELDPKSPQDNFIEVSAVEMTDEQYNQLPEFCGW